MTRVAVGVNANFSKSSSSAHATSVTSPPAIVSPEIRWHKKSTITKWNRGRLRSSIVVQVSSAPCPKLIRSKTSIISITRTCNPVSSVNSRAVPSISVSPSSNVPPGIDHCPFSGSFPRRINSTRWFSITTPPTPTIGRSGNSRHELISPRFLCRPACCRMNLLDDDSLYAKAAGVHQYFDFLVRGI